MSVLSLFTSRHRVRGAHVSKRRGGAVLETILILPVLLYLARDKAGAVATLKNTTAAPVKAEVAMLLGGAERGEIA